MVAQWFCGMASVTANSRMAYAFSRDGALPGSRLWKKVNPRTGTPTNSIWLCVTLSTLLVLPSLWNTTAYLAATSIAVIGLYIAYVGPVLLRRLQPGLPARARGTWASGARRSAGSRSSGWSSSACCSSCRRPARSRRATSTTRSSPWWSWSARPRSGGSRSARKWFTGPQQNLIEKAAHGEPTMPTAERPDRGVSDPGRKLSAPCDRTNAWISRTWTSPSTTAASTPCCSP